MHYIRVLSLFCWSLSCSCLHWLYNNSNNNNNNNSNKNYLVNIKELQRKTTIKKIYNTYLTVYKKARAIKRKTSKTRVFSISFSLSVYIPLFPSPSLFLSSNRTHKNSLIFLKKKTWKNKYKMETIIRQNKGMFGIR